MINHREDSRKIVSGILVLLFLIFVSVMASVQSSDNFRAQPIAFAGQETGLIQESEIVEIVEKALDDKRFKELEEELNKILTNRSGIWSVYVKNLSTDNVILINDQPIYSASLIKLFAMEYAYQEMETLISYGNSEKRIKDTIKAMITVSDNDAYNELVSLCSSNRYFIDGCLKVNDYLENSMYQNTGIYHTLHPCRSPWLRKKSHNYRRLW